MPKVRSGVHKLHSNLFFAFWPGINVHDSADLFFAGGKVFQFQFLTHGNRLSQDDQCTVSVHHTSFCALGERNTIADTETSSGTVNRIR